MFETTLKSLVVYVSMGTRLLNIDKDQMIPVVHVGSIAG